MSLQSRVACMRRSRCLSPSMQQGSSPLRILSCFSHPACLLVQCYWVDITACLSCRPTMPPSTLAPASACCVSGRGLELGGVPLPLPCCTMVDISYLALPAIQLSWSAEKPHSCFESHCSPCVLICHVAAASPSPNPFANINAMITQAAQANNNAVIGTNAAVSTFCSGEGACQP